MVLVNMPKTTLYFQKLSVPMECPGIVRDLAMSPNCGVHSVNLVNMSDLLCLKPILSPCLEGMN